MTLSLDPLALRLPLSARELQILQLVAQGDSDKRIARSLGLSKLTVSNHIRHVRQKLAVPNRSAAVAVALRAGILR